MHYIPKYAILLFLWFPSLGQTDDLTKHAENILEKAKRYYQLISANAKTLELTGTNDLIFTYQENQELISLVFPADTSGNISRTIKYELPSLDILSDDKEPRTQTQREKLYKTMVLKMFASTMYFPLPKRFWAIIEEVDGRFFAYLIPRQESSTQLILGNDYVFKYTLTGEFKDFKFLHNNAIPIPTNVQQKDEVEGTLHTHANRNDAFITALDIATILSCKGQLNGTKHLVTSRKYVSIFDSDKMTLEIVTKQEYETRTGKKLKF